MAQLPDEPEDRLPYEIADWHTMCKDPEPTGREKALRDLFISEYLYDFDGYAAAMRIGFGAAFAKEYSVKMLGESYVQQEVRRRQEDPTDIIHDETALQNRVLTGLLREANYKGPGASHAARIAAFAKLATMLGMDKAQRVEHDVKHRGGVMVVPAAPATPEEWERIARAQQEKLINASLE